MFAVYAKTITKPEKTLGCCTLKTVRGAERRKRYGKSLLIILSKQRRSFQRSKHYNEIYTRTS